MRWSRTLIKTQREKTHADLSGLGYLLQTGIIRPAGSGFYDWGILGKQVRDNIAYWLRAKTSSFPLNLLTLSPWRTDILNIPLQEITTSPDAHTISASWYVPALLAHANQAITSYKHLPLHVGTLGPVYREEARARAGLLRTRAFTVSENLSLTGTIRDARKAQRAWLDVWADLLQQAEIPVVRGLRGDALGNTTEALLWQHPSGDTTYLHCPTCDTWFHPNVAPFARDTIHAPLHPLERILTPGCTTIESLCSLLNITPEETAKSMFLVAGEELPVIAVVRGDTDVSPTKLRRVLGAITLRPATEEEIRAWGAEPGYGSPVGIKGALIIADPAVILTPNLVAGANRADFHLRNVNAGRDFIPHVVADIASAPHHARCASCNTPYEHRPAWVLASASQPYHPQVAILPGLLRAIPFTGLEKKLPSPLPTISYLNQEGRPETPWMVRAVLGVERLIGAIAETHHDDAGLTWPSPLAPCRVHLVVLPSRKDPRVAETANRIYEQLQAAGVPVLYDDRDERAGVKFNDADLIGCPLRITVSARTLKQNAVELKPRREGDAQLVPLADVVQVVLSWKRDARP